MTIFENITPLEGVIRVLEAYKKGGLADTGGTTCLDGFNQALRIIRTLSTTFSINDQGDRLLQAFEEYAHTKKSTRTLDIKGCSACGKDHDRLIMVSTAYGEWVYWGFCPVLIQVIYAKDK